MIIVKLWGGMCNQMFQYAFGYALAKKHNDRLVFDVDFYANQPGHVGKRGVIGQEQFPALKGMQFKNRSFILKLLENKYLLYLVRYSFGLSLNLNRLFFIVEKNHKYYEIVPYKKSTITFYDGYWQSQDYFIEFNDDIRAVFEPHPEICRLAKNWRASIANPNCVAVHVRRGDYLNPNNKKSLGAEGVVDNVKYYQDAINIIKEKYPEAMFCFFSDDIAWCKTKFSSLSNVLFVENNCKNAALVDLVSISYCEHGIMSQSSFSWWGNWLRKNVKNTMVICPKANPGNENYFLDNWIII